MHRLFLLFLSLIISTASQHSLHLPCSPPFHHRYDPISPETDLKVLKMEAGQGLPVKGFKPTWEEGRPTALPPGEKANKGRGFIAYERKPLPYRCGTMP